MDNVITDVKQVTPDWLTTALQTNGHLDHEQVTAVVIKSSRQTIISNTHHLEITYSAVTSERSPSKLFLKLSKPGFDSELAARLGKRESQYYNVVVKSMNDPPSATCYDAAFSPDTGKSHVLLVDLSETHFQTDWPLPPSKPYCEAVLDSFAKFHAAWWDHPQLGNSVGKLPTNDSIDEYVQSMEKKFAGFVDFLDDRLSAERRRLYERVLSTAPGVWKERIRERNPNEKHLTLIHGDAHFWNCLYPRRLGQGKVYIIDWQGWRIDTATDDLAYMIALHWYPERRRAMEYDLLRYYYSKLLMYGVENYDWDAFWYDYKLSVIGNLFIPVWQWSAKLWPAIWWPHFERAILAFEDLECAEFLESPG
jgi:thiamine kinase-like enzyme